MNSLKHLVLLILVVLLSNAAGIEKDTIFPTPDILKNNVAFWKKIYTEISLSEGVIHDRDYPMVIYERLKGDYNSPSVKARKEAIAITLRSIASKQGTGLTKGEEALFAIYKEYGDTSVLNEAAERIRFQMGQKERFREGLERSGRYLDTIRQIMKAYSVPQRLAYLPHVESSFNTEAYSKVGAAGLWQFMRGTGKIYGMKIDYSIDERRDPIIASVAAAKYLSSAYAELKSWPLAITSYNHGIYGMKRAVSQTGSNDISVIIQKYSSRSFRFASSNFYGCFLAASEIAEDYKTHFPGTALLPAIKFTDTKLPFFIEPDLLCTLFGISPQQLASLNPAIRSSVFEQKKRLPKGLVLHLPATILQEKIQVAFNTLPDSLRQLGPERSSYYTVIKGDNLYTIASRLGVSVKDLALENNISKKNRIYAGQVLHVPGAAISAVKQVEVAAVTKTTVVPEKKTSEPVMASPQVEAAVEIAQAELAQITPPEDTLQVVIATPQLAETQQPKSEASKQTSAQPQKVALTKKEAIKKDTTQQVSPEPLSDSLKAIAMAPALPAPEVSSKVKPVLPTVFDISLYNLDAVISSGGSRATIFVSIDETIGHYADWLSIPTWQIRKLNDMGRGSNIRVNQKLMIPVNKQDALDQFSSARLEYHMAIEEDFYAQYMVADVKSHIVKRGETIWDFCNESDATIPIWLLNKYNKQVDLGKLTPGMTVWIPEISELTQEEINRRSAIQAQPEPQPVRIPLQRLPQKSVITP